MTAATKDWVHKIYSDSTTSPLDEEYHFSASNCAHLKYVEYKSYAVIEQMQ